MRHAKSSWDQEGIDDFFRPLNKRGQKAALEMGHYLAQKGLYPQRVLCSSAQRTRETFAHVLPQLPETMDVRFSRTLYEADVPDLITGIRAFGQNDQTLLVVGHNPTIQEGALLLAGRGSEQARKDMSEKFPSAGLAIIDFEGLNWANIVPRSGWLAGFITPRQLGS